MDLNSDLHLIHQCLKQGISLVFTFEASSQFPQQTHPWKVLFSRKLFQARPLGHSLLETDMKNSYYSHIVSPTLAVPFPPPPSLRSSVGSDTLHFSLFYSPKTTGFFHLHNDKFDRQQLQSMISHLEPRSSPFEIPLVHLSALGLNSATAPHWAKWILFKGFAKHWKFICRTRNISSFPSIWPPTKQCPTFYHWGTLGWYPGP